MSDEFYKILSPVILKVAGYFIEANSFGIKSSIEKLKIDFGIGIKNYINSQYSIYSKTKTIISNNAPIDIRTIYVNLTLHCGERTIFDYEIPNLAEEGMQIIVSGSAGSGKSMIMRYIYLEYLKENRDKIPVFLNLRETNNSSSPSIIDTIIGSMARYIDNFNKTQMLHALKRGHIILFLDGFDEIDYTFKAERLAEIDEISKTYPATNIVLSSRPDYELNSLERFTVFNIGRLTKAQVNELISKINYSKTIKDSFLARINNGLYEQHQQFLVNALLTIIMLITFEQFSEIPAKVYLFYEHAFEVLFLRHDATKSGFRRKKYVGIAIDDYKKLFSFYCMITYAKEIFSFSREQALRYIANSAILAEINIDKEKMLNDLMYCTCMLIEDGINIAFSHRSFQEYFVAYYISRCNTSDCLEILARLGSRGEMDEVCVLLSEMNRDLFEKTWALPEVERMVSTINGIDPASRLITLIKLLFGDAFLKIEEKKQAFGVAHLTSFSRSIGLLDKIYGYRDKMHRPQNISDSSKVIADVVSGRISSQVSEIINEGGEKTYSINLSESDNHWFSRTEWASFIINECDSLLNLRNLLVGKVDIARNRTKSIFDI